MNVKRYLAEDAAEAMKKIRDDLGPDAVILNTRHIKRKGFLGFLKKPMVEMVAAYEQPVIKPQAAEMLPPKAEVRPERTVPAKDLGVSADGSKADGKKRNEVFQEELLKAWERLPESDERDNRIRNLEEKLDALSMLIKDMSARVDAPHLAGGRRPLPPKMEHIRLHLQEQEVHAEVLTMLLESAAESVTEDGADPVEAMEESIKHLLGEPVTLQIEESKRKVVLLCGPTGVGKTTTLAKLAAKYSISGDAKTGIITTDTFRIAAVEQLKTYAEIMELPIEIAYSTDEIPKLLERFKDFNLVFIDTAGRSPSDPILREETEEIIKKSGADEIFLVLSATTSFSGCLRILDTYSFLSEYKLLFTKIDESESLGIVPSVRYLTDKPLTYLSVGQRVPDDIESADAEKIASRLMGRKHV